MNLELNINKKVFNELYFPYLTDYSHKFEVLYGGSGSGKSHFIVQKLIIKALTYKRKILVIRKTMVSQKESCWRLTLNILSDWDLLQYCNVNKSDMTIELPNGSVFLFKGLDDPERIKSIVGITDCWCEEVTELNAEDFDQLILRVRDRVPHLQFFCSFNPVSKANFVYKRWFSEDADLEDTLIIKSTYKDNKFLPDDYIKTLENTIKTNPLYYRIYALGEFCSLDKLVFTNWKVENFNYNDIKGELLVGLDFGFSIDTTALIASVLDEHNKKIYIFKEWGATNKTNNEIARVIESLGFGKSTIVADSAEPKSIEEIRRCGIYRIKESVKGRDSVIHGIQRLQQYEIIVHPSCEKTITELENYSWKKDRQSGEYVNEPIDDFNHFIDALRYSLQCVDGGRLRTMSKTKLGL